MTEEEARGRARVRWGTRGWAWISGFDVVRRGRCRVGVWNAAGPKAYGSGNTFEAAFADADEREGRNDKEVGS